MFRQLEHNYIKYSVKEKWLLLEHHQLLRPKDHYLSGFMKLYELQF